MEAVSTLELPIVNIATKGFFCIDFKQRVDQGAAVIVGRVANFLLKYRKNLVPFSYTRATK